jgi:cytochrome b561
MAEPARYTRTAIVLHWTLAFALAASFAFGLYMTDLPGSVQKLKFYNWHKWAGVLILALSLVRLAWRLAHRPPPLPPMPAWQARASAWVHRAMYLLFVAVPLAGWAYSSAAGYPVVLFGVLPLPDFVPADRELAAAVRPLHRWLAYALAALVALHVAAVAQHQWLRRDGLLGRMGPPRRGAA